MPPTTSLSLSRLRAAATTCRPSLREALDDRLADAARAAGHECYAFLGHDCVPVRVFERVRARERLDGQAAVDLLQQPRQHAARRQLDEPRVRLRRKLLHRLLPANRLDDLVDEQSLDGRDVGVRLRGDVRVHRRARRANLDLLQLRPIRSAPRCISGLWNAPATFSGIALKPASSAFFATRSHARRRAADDDLPRRVEVRRHEHLALRRTLAQLVHGGLVGAHDADHPAGRRDGGLLHVPAARGDEPQAVLERERAAEVQRGVLAQAQTRVRGYLFGADDSGGLAPRGSTRRWSRRSRAG